MRLRGVFRSIATLIGVFPMMVAAGASGAIDVVGDGGFEAGQFGGTWTEFSTNFGTPICSIALCGLGGGTGPHSGSYWVWLGGVDSDEVAWVSQAVTIPVASSAQLSFWLQIPVGANAADFFEVSLDGYILFYTDGADPAVGLASYVLHLLDVMPFADGGTHTLQLRGSFSDTGGMPGASITNFFVDDVSLVVVPEPSFSLMLGIGIGMLLALARLRGGRVA